MDIRGDYSSSGTWVVLGRQKITRGSPTPVKQRNSLLFDEQAHKTIQTTPYMRMHCIMDYHWLSGCTRPNWLPDI